MLDGTAKSHKSHEGAGRGSQSRVSSIEYRVSYFIIHANQLLKTNDDLRCAFVRRTIIAIDNRTPRTPFPRRGYINVPVNALRAMGAFIILRALDMNALRALVASIIIRAIDMVALRAINFFRFIILFFNG
jgi:hypothetical protein